MMNNDEATFIDPADLKLGDPDQIRNDLYHLYKWTPEEADYAVGLYRFFLFLVQRAVLEREVPHVVNSFASPVMPPHFVDKVWQWHINKGGTMETYCVDCNQLFGTYLAYKVNVSSTCRDELRALRVTFAEPMQAFFGQKLDREMHMSMQKKRTPFDRRVPVSGFEKPIPKNVKPAPPSFLIHR